MPGDIPAEELRRALHRVADLVADYVGGVGDYPVAPPVEPGEVRAALPATPPERPESMDAILDDYRRVIEPNVTHWNHPGFMGYFGITGSGPGIVGEALAAALNVNAMLWRTSPAATELEELTCDWLRQMIGLPAGFHGHINDTASISTMLALAAARHGLSDLDVRTRGMGGRGDVPKLVVYCSDQAHSSVDKAVIALGLGHENLRRVPSDSSFRMRPAALRQALAADLAAGNRPVAVVATVGTTSTTSADPVAEIADVCESHGVWLHVDAAYAGSAAVCPELRESFAGWERAQSIVTNPHKWLFTPVDCSVLFVRDPQQLRATFSLVPEYLATSEEGVTNLMDLGVQLGRRFRALKLWMVIRRFGVEGIREAIREHCAMARELAGWIEGDPNFEVCAPVPFSVVCLRWSPPGESGEETDRRNRSLMEAVNADGSIFISHTELHGRYVLRVAIGNLKTTREHVAAAWRLIRERAYELAATG